MNTQILSAFAKEITKTSGLGAEWGHFAADTIGSTAKGAVKTLLKHPYLALGTAATVATLPLTVPFMDQVYTFHLMHKQNRLAKEQNERLDNLQKIQQAQLSQALGVAHPDLAASMRPKIVASPLA